MLKICRHSRAGGNPESDKLNVLDPRLRGNDGKNTPMAHLDYHIRNRQTLNS